ncbi:MAG TPA: M23 family metallopeptidase [bacterium]|nr:M23 family metallopeptidase [bacterium]HQG47219.1 M23 family metallopeptidase [bacterium]HQI48161.1 M23 family metallopeptidase [bacterium]HQJ65704.1 M23 family metallopeptidase [bacterium]
MKKMPSPHSRPFLLLLLAAGALWNCCRKAPDTPHTAELKPREKILLRKEGTFRHGETLEKVLLRDLYDRVLTRELVTTFARVFDVRKIRGERGYSILTDSLGTVHGFEYYPEEDKTIRVVRDSLGVLQPHVVQLPLIRKIFTLSGEVKTTLYDAVRQMGESDELIIAFSDLFQWDIDFFVDPQPGDEFRMVYEADYVRDPSRPDSLGDFIRYGRVLSGQYRCSGVLRSAIFYQQGEQPGYYDLEGRSFQKTFLKSPLNYRRISSLFSGGRRHPILKIVRPHYGVDFVAAAGTPVSAAADGTVLEMGYEGGGLGNFIKIRHKNPRFVTVYGHLSGFAAGLTAGKMVAQRDVIGYVGRTGLATGPHLHYCFYENGRPVNPLKIKNSSGDPIPAAEMARFETVKAAQLALLAAAPVRGKALQPVLAGTGPAPRAIPPF